MKVNTRIEELFWFKEVMCPKEMLPLFVLLKKRRVFNFRVGRIVDEMK